MARLIGPDEGSRLVYLSSGTDQGKAVASGLPVLVYSDSGATSLADIQTTGGVAISGSALTVDAYSQIPLFKFPDGTDTVYVKVNGGPATAVYARTDDRLDTLETAVTTTNTAVTAVRQRLGNSYIGFGDSISSVTGGAGFGNSWTIAAPMLSNQRLTYLENAGISGNTTAQMLARIQTDVIAYAPKVVTVLGGTNDLTGGVTFATWSANITAIVAALQAAGATPVLCTIPPRGNTTYLATTITWNNWLKHYARLNGLGLLDFFSALVDPATGMFASGYDSGDALHPSPAGHMVMAALVNTQLVPQLPPFASIRPVSNTGDADNLVTNPLMLTGTPTPTGFAASGTAMTGYTEGLTTDTDFLGKAWEWSYTAPSVGTNFRQISFSIGASGWSVGDRLLFVARHKLVSLSGVTAGSNIGLRFTGSFFSAGTPTVTWTPGDTVVHAGGLRSFRYTVPASTTSIAINAIVSNIATSATYVARVGEFGIFNLTTLGLS